MDYYYHDQSNPYGTGEHPPPHQFNRAPLGVPGEWSQSYEPSQPQDSTRPISGYAYPLSMVGRQDPTLSMLRPEYQYENDTRIKHEDTPEPMPVSGGIIRTGMTPTPRLYDPAATMHPHSSVEQYDDNGESVGDASHDNSGRDGDVSGQESPVPKNDANGETPSPGEGHSDVAEEEDNHHHSHPDRHHHEETSDTAPRTPPNLGEDRNVDIPSSDAVTVVEAEEQVNPAGWGYEGGGSDDDDDDSDYRFVEEVTSPWTSYVSSDSDRPPAGNAAAPQGSDHESSSDSDSVSDSNSDSGSDSGSNPGLEEGENADREPRYRTIRLRDLTAFARESAADFQGRSIIVVAGDCHLNRLPSASTSTRSEEAASVVLVAGDMYTYPSGSSSSSSSRQKRKRDDSRGEGEVRRRLDFS